MTDAITRALIAHQTPVTAHLWTPSDAVTFTPAVLDHVFGDGRALFRVTTINSRPRWWLVRGDSGWSEDRDGPEGTTEAERDLFIDHVDDVVQAIADEFGGLPNMEDENDAEAYVDHATGKPFDPADLVYPQIDDRTGTFWQRIDWPDLPGVAFAPHPFDRTVRILAEPVPA